MSVRLGLPIALPQIFHTLASAVVQQAQGQIQVHREHMQGIGQAMPVAIVISLGVRYRYPLSGWGGIGQLPHPIATRLTRSMQCRNPRPVDVFRVLRFCR